MQNRKVKVKYYVSVENNHIEYMNEYITSLYIRSYMYFVKTGICNKNGKIFDQIDLDA